MITRKKNLAILGSTGSIGKNTLSVVRNLPDLLSVKYLSTNKNIDVLKSQIEEFKPKGVVVTDSQKANELRKSIRGSTEVIEGEEGLIEITAREDIDIVVNALVGFVGLKPTIEAIKARKTIALANKETLVAGGELITGLQKKYNVDLIPIDSEHSAIFQCLAGENKKKAARIILTASGGPFLNTPIEHLESVTLEQALNHPNWKMGKKITIDSATLMNKGLEVIEAHWLFDIPAEKIEVVIHPQSIIHSMVEFIDGSIKAQLGVPDMKIPIQYALTYPERLYMNGNRLDFPAIGTMTFYAPNRKKFRCLELAYQALACGGTAPVVMNAANEVAVQAFIEKRITFNQIPQIVEQSIEKLAKREHLDITTIVECDREARNYAQVLITNMQK